MNSIKELAAFGAAYLTSSNTPRLDAELLLCSVLKISKENLFLKSEDLLTKAEASSYAALIERRKQGEPIAYLIGRKEFYGLEFEVTPAVLIPRPETEMLVELALNFLKGRANEKRLLDLGTGSGCIALSIANSLKASRESFSITATDLSSDALEIARRNAMKLGLTKEVTFVRSDWFKDLSFEGKFSCIVSNPPYIGVDDKNLGRGTEFEPKSALFSGAPGLDDIKSILSSLPSYLEPKGAAFIEFGFGQKEEISSFVKSQPLLELEDIYDDLSGIPRVLALKNRAF